MIRAAWIFVVVVATAASTAVAQDVSERNRHDALKHYRLGTEALHSERFDVAQREFQSAIKLNPLLYIAHYGLGQAYMFTKRYPLAVRAYCNARDAFHASAVEALGNEGAYGRQLDDQLRALEDTKRRVEVNESRAKVLDAGALLQQIENQILELRRARRLPPMAPQPTPAWISLALGSAYFRTDALGDAEREYREAIKASPELGEAHNNLAVVLMVTGRYEEAAKEINAAERAGVRVNDQFKDELEQRRDGKF